MRSRASNVPEQDVSTSSAGCSWNGFRTLPVVRCRLAPYEAYIAPTENLVHDGSTMGQRDLDQQFTVLGHIAPLGQREDEMTMMKVRQSSGRGVVSRASHSCIAFVAATLPAGAQDWPTKSVKIISPFGAGSTPDLVARMIADYLQQKLGQTFIVEDKPGASGNTGTDAVAKAEPDGYTIGISIGGPLAINPLLFSKLPYDPAKDIALITMLATQPSALAVNTDLGVNSVAELIDLLKFNPGKFNFGSIGNGSLSHLAMEAIALKSGTQMVHIPYASLAAGNDRAGARRRADGRACRRSR